MNRFLIVLLIMGLIMVANGCNRSTEKSKPKPTLMEEGKSLEKKAVGEVKKLEQDLKVFEEEKTVEKEMGKEIEQIPPPQEDWGHGADDPELD